MVEAMGVKIGVGQGSDLIHSKQLMEEAFNEVRTGHGPYFLEFSTYRWREHCGHAFDNDIGYRTQEEFIEWQAKDPLLMLEKSLSHADSDYCKQIDEIKLFINSEIKAAFDFAEKSPFPLQYEAYENVYAT
jgi:pyruvate dehydrogenase E1 component alpha subunit